MCCGKDVAHDHLMPDAMCRQASLQATKVMASAMLTSTKDKQCELGCCVKHVLKIFLLVAERSLNPPLRLGCVVEPHAAASFTLALASKVPLEGRA